MKTSLTGNSIERQIGCFVELVESLETKKIQVPLVWVVLLKITDLKSQWNRSYQSQRMSRGNEVVV